MKDRDHSMLSDNGRTAGALRSQRNNSVWELRRATRTVAHHATDAADAADLLAMLGLDPKMGVEKRRAA